MTGILEEGWWVRGYIVIFSEFYIVGRRSEFKIGELIKELKYYSLSVLIII